MTKDDVRDVATAPKPLYQGEVVAAMTDETHQRHLPARLDFHLDPSVRTVLDGAWWPRSRDTAAGLTALVVALDARQVPITLIMLNPEGWQGHPRRIEAAGRTVQVSWFAELDPAVLIATTDSCERIDLLLAIDDAPADSALAALMADSDDDDEEFGEASVLHMLSRRESR
jgi:hypothetical protein